MYNEKEKLMETVKRFRSCTRDNGNKKSGGVQFKRPMFEQDHRSIQERVNGCQFFLHRKSDTTGNILGTM